MKHAEIGSEPDPATFIDTLLALTAEWGRVLAPWGSIAIELGDTYSGSGGAGGDYNPGGLREGQQVFSGSATVGRIGRVGQERDPQGFTGRSSHGAGGGTNWPRPKCLALVPQAYALSLAYGRNVLNGNPSPAGQWLVRNMIVWHRPNPAVGALGDKFRPSTSYITVATRSAKRWFDEFDEHDTWTLTTQPSSLAHYAMWPAKLAERLVLSMCPAWVCGECGESQRRVEKSVRLGNDSHANPWDAQCKTGGPCTSGLATRPETLGWTTCGHDAYRPGVVLDPFAGTGTTLAVADLHGRDAIGIDIDERNPALYEKRRAEVHRSLFGARPQSPGQLDLFGGAA